MERSSAASFTPPIPPPPLAPPLAPVWVQQGTTGVWIGSIQVPFLELAASSRSQPHMGHPPSSTTQADVSTANSGQSFTSVLLPPLCQNRLLQIVQGLTTLVVFLSDSPIVLNPQASPRKYKLLRGSNSVHHLWTEWVFGLGGGPSVEALDRCWGGQRGYVL
jgi:hypothetical protein